MTQNLIVALIVVVAAAYAALKLMPAHWRRRLATQAAAAGHRRGWVDRRGAERLARSLGAGGCGSCDTCGSCTKPASAADSRSTPVRAD